MSSCEDKSDTIDKIIHKSHVASAGEVREPNKVITVRIPQSLHEAIKEEAHQRRCSMNKLAAAKLRIKGEVLDKILADPLLNGKPCADDKEERTGDDVQL